MEARPTLTRHLRLTTEQNSVVRKISGLSTQRRFIYQGVLVTAGPFRCNPFSIHSSSWRAFSRASWLPRFFSRHLFSNRPVQLLSAQGGRSEDHSHLIQAETMSMQQMTHFGDKRDHGVPSGPHRNRLAPLTPPVGRDVAR